MIFHAAIYLLITNAMITRVINYLHDHSISDKSPIKKFHKIVDEKPIFKQLSKKNEDNHEDEGNHEDKGGNNPLHNLTHE